MKTLLFAIILSLIILSSISDAEAKPYRTDQELIDSSDIVLTGTIISKDTQSMSGYISYEIKVEKYLKNPQQNNVMTIIGHNLSGGLLGNTIFNVGDKGLFYLNNYTQKYDDGGPLFISPYSTRILDNEIKNSGITDSNQTKLSTLDCADKMAEQGQKYGISNDNATAISLALDSEEFKSKVKGYRFEFNSIYNEWHFDPITCNNLTLLNVNVAYSLYDSNGYVKNVVVRESSDLTKILGVFEQVTGFYGSPSSNKPNIDKPVSSLEERLDEGGSEAECLGPANTCPEVREMIQEREDYQRFIVISAIGIPALAVSIVTVVWYKLSARKTRVN